MRQIAVMTMGTISSIYERRTISCQCSAMNLFTSKKTTNSLNAHTSQSQRFPYQHMTQHIYYL